MTNQQAKRLGAVIRKAREAKGLSYRELAEHTGVAQTWLKYLETGRSLEPLPSRVGRVTEALELDPAVIDRVSGGYLASSLPTVRTYFRSKGRASVAELDEIERVVAEIHAKYGTPLEDDSDAAPEARGGGRT